MDAATEQKKSLHTKRVPTIRTSRADNEALKSEGGSVKVTGQKSGGEKMDEDSEGWIDGGGT